MDKVQNNFRIADEYRRVGQLEQAQQRLRMVLEDDAGNSSALHALSTIAIQTGNPAEAEALVRQAIVIDEKNPGYWYTLACILFSLNQVSAAEDALATAAQHGLEDSAEVSDLKGWLSLRRNNNRHAVNHFQAAANKRAPENLVKVRAFNKNSIMDPAAHARGKPYVKELHDVMLDTEYCWYSTETISTQTRLQEEILPIALLYENG